MAEVLEPTGQTGPARRTYPWAEWLDGRPWHIRQSKPEHPDPERRAGDFDTTQESMRSYLYQQAKKHNRRIVLHCSYDDSILLQAYEHGVPRPVLPGAPPRNGVRHRKGGDGRAAGQATGSPGGYIVPANVVDPPPEYRCRHCGARLNPTGHGFGECRLSRDPDYRCSANPASAGAPDGAPEQAAGN